MECQFLNQALNLCPLQWKPRVSTGGARRKLHPLGAIERLSRLLLSLLWIQVIQTSTLSTSKPIKKIPLCLYRHLYSGIWKNWSRRFHLQSRNRDPDAENKCMPMEKGCGMDWDVGIEAETLLILYIKEVATENRLSSTWNCAECSVVTWMGKRCRKGDICIGIADACETWGFPGGSAGKESACNARVCLQYRRPEFNPRVTKIPWRREWQPTPVFLPGESGEPGGLQSVGLQSQTPVRD